MNLKTEKIPKKPRAKSNRQSRPKKQEGLASNSPWQYRNNNFMPSGVFADTFDVYNPPAQILVDQGDLAIDQPQQQNKVTFNKQRQSKKIQHQNSPYAKDQSQLIQVQPKSEKFNTVKIVRKKEIKPKRSILRQTSEASLEEQKQPNSNIDLTNMNAIKYQRDNILNTANSQLNTKNQFLIMSNISEQPIDLEESEKSNFISKGQYEQQSSSIDSSQFTEPFSRQFYTDKRQFALKLNPSQIKYAQDSTRNTFRSPMAQMKAQSRNLIETESTDNRIVQCTENSIEYDQKPNNFGQIQKVRLKISKLTQAKKFSTPVECGSIAQSPLKLRDQLTTEQSQQEFANRNYDHNIIKRFNSPSSIKVIDLKQPKVRKLLMESLQEIVKERKQKMHQKEAKLFNSNYDQILKNTMQNRSVKVEQSIQGYQEPFPLGSYETMQDPEPEQQIISKPTLPIIPPRMPSSEQINQQNTNPQKSFHMNSHTHSGVNLIQNFDIQEGQNLRRMTSDQQFKLVQRLNEIYDEQNFTDHNSGQEQSVSQPQSGSDDKEEVQYNIELDSNQDEQQCQIFSAINNDCLLFIDSPSKKRPSENEQIYPRTTFNGSQHTSSLQDLMLANYSRNNHKQQINQVLSTDKQTLFLINNDQANDLSLNRQLKHQNITKMPSITDLTFFDLSNPVHLNKLFGRLEEIQKQESINSDSRELPRAVAQTQQSEEPIQIPTGEEVQGKQSGSQSGEISSYVSSAQTKTPIHSRQGIEQHTIDVDLLIQKLLQVPNVDVLDSIFYVEQSASMLNLNLQPSNGTNERNEGTPHEAEEDAASMIQLQRIQDDLGEILNEQRAQGGESISSGGRASEIQSSGMMTPRSQNSLSTPNQLRLLQERNFNIQGFKFPQNSGGTANPQHDLMSPLTKKLLMQKLKEVKEQIGDNESDSDDEDQVDGIVAGSTPDPQVFADIDRERAEKKWQRAQKYFYDQKTGTIIQRALDNNKNHRTKLIISNIDEEDENMQEDMSNIDNSKLHQGQTKLNSLVSPSPQVEVQSQRYSQDCQQSSNNQPSIDLLINKLKQLEIKQRANTGSVINRESQNCSHQSDEQSSPMKIGNINIYNMPRGLHQDDMYKQSGSSPMDNNEYIDSRQIAQSRNQSVANILEQVINRLESFKSRDNSMN